MTFSGKMLHTITLKVTKKWGFALSLVNVILEKTCAVASEKLSWIIDTFFAASRVGSDTLISGILQTSKFKFTTESFWGSTWFIDFDRLIICIHFGNCKPPVSLKHGAIILNRSNNSVFLRLEIYWNRQLSDLIRASGIWMKLETLRHQASSSKF